MEADTPTGQRCTGCVQQPAVATEILITEVSSFIDDGTLGESVARLLLDRDLTIGAIAAHVNLGILQPMPPSQRDALNLRSKRLFVVL